MNSSFAQERMWLWLTSHYVCYYQVKFATVTKHFLSEKKKNYSNYKSIIFDTTYHFGASRDFRRSHYVSHHKLYFLWHWVLSQDHKFLLCITIGLWKINGISKWKEKKEDSVAMLTALLQIHALCYSKWLVELHSWYDALAQRINVSYSKSYLQIS